jgi:hypothetical protein
MTTCMPSLLTASMLALALLADSAQAQNRVFVAAQGLDSNPCTFAQPCRSFQKAHDTVAAKGEIDVLDPAGYGAVNITKAISIQGHGFAGISAASGNAISISAGPGDNINLRGILIDGVGTGVIGVAFFAGGSLNIQDCLIRDFGAPGNFGILFVPGASSNLTVYDTVISDNLGPSINPGTGIGLIPVANLTAVVERVVMDNNGFGLAVVGSDSNGSINVTVSNSTATHNISGISTVSASASTVVMVRNSTAANNSGSGVSAEGNSIIRVTHSTITGNGVGIATLAGGQVVSFGDNSLAGNTTDGAPTSTIPLQ